jgi:hypothetical protein
VRVIKLKRILLGTRSFYTDESKRRCSSYCTYSKPGETGAFIGKIIHLMYIPAANKFLGCLRRIDAVSEGKLFYKERKNTGVYDIVPIQHFIDQCIVCTIDKEIYLAECQGLTFTIPDDQYDNEYPKDEEQEELMEFYKDELQHWCKD